DRVRRETQQLRGRGTYPTAVARTPLDINLNIGVDSPAEFLESLPEPCSPELSFPIVLGVKHQHANPPHAPRLLRARRERPRNRRAANKSEEFPPRNNHSITSSAYDFYADGFCWKYANYMHYGFTELAPPELYDSLVQNYQRFSRNPTDGTLGDLQT